MNRMHAKASTSNRRFTLRLCSDALKNYPPGQAVPFVPSVELRFPTIVRQIPVFVTGYELVILLLALLRGVVMECFARFWRRVFLTSPIECASDPRLD